MIQIIETTLSYASVMGLKQDLDLEGDQYQWLGSLFYFGLFRLRFSFLNWIFLQAHWKLMVIRYRISCMGIPYQPPPSASPIRKILCSLHLDLGTDPQLFRRGENLLRCNRYPLYARCI